MTARLDVTPKTTEQNRIVRTGKSEAEVTNNKKTALEYCTITVNLTTGRHEASRGLFATAQLLPVTVIIFAPSLLFLGYTLYVVHVFK